MKRIFALSVLIGTVALGGARAAEPEDAYSDAQELPTSRQILNRRWDDSPVPPLTSDAVPAPSSQAEAEAELRAKYDWARDPEPGQEIKVVKPSAEGRKMIVIAASKENGEGLLENMDMRFDGFKKGAVQVRILSASSSDTAAISAALRKAAADGADTVILDGEFAKTDEVSQVMDDLRAKGVYARAVGTAWMKYRNQ